MPAPVLQEIVPLLPQVESASLRHSKLIASLDKDTKRGEIEKVIQCQKLHSTRIPQVTPRGAVTLFAKLGGRLIVNQAGGVLENAGLCLHRHFNDPFIPGAAVKGIAAHAAWCEWHDECDPAKKEAVARNIAAVFGYPTSDKSLDAFLADLGFADAASGTVAFLAAIPSAKPALALDITNSHHMKYYGSENPAAVALDNEEPNPQFFPVIEADVAFRFTLAPLKPNANLDAAKRWLIAAITVNGAGAKTAAGYGWFTYDEAENERIRQAEADAEKRRTQAIAFAAEKAALPALDNIPDSSLQELRAACATVEAFLQKWKELPPADTQPIRDSLGKNRKRLPQQSELERFFANAGDNGQFRQFFEKRFPDLKTDEKTEVVRWLASPDGNARWLEIRDAAGKGKKPWSLIVPQIHAAKKAAELKLP